MKKLKYLKIAMSICHFMDVQDCNLVFVDMETTGESPFSRIIQLSAIVPRFRKNIDIYINPNSQISQAATNIHGFEIKSDNKLYRHGRQVKCQLPKQALRKFLEFLSGLAPVLLVGHNSHYFMLDILERHMECFGLDKAYGQIVWGWSDTLPLLKSHLKLKFKRQTRFKLEELAKDYLKSEKRCGDALRDCQTLIELLEAVGLKDGDLLDFISPLEYD